MFKYAICVKNEVSPFGDFDSPIEAKDYLTKRGWKQNHPISTNWKHWVFTKGKLIVTIENIKIIKPIEIFEKEFDV